MGNVIPFFYYDILARIVPGALTLGVLAFAGVEVPDAWAGLFVSGGSWSAVVTPLVCAGACYVVGVLYEAFFAVPGVHWLYNWMITFAYRRAKRDRHGRESQGVGSRITEWRYDMCPSKGYGQSKKDRIDLEHRFSRWGIGENARVFAHAHRFQAEAKMCLHSFLPALFFVYCAREDVNSVGCWQQQWLFWIGVVVAILFAWGAYARERRRWLQALAWEDARCEKHVGDVC
ncbi:MAG: hypothetical protein JXQ75_20470 [Phycisphaerae bacterium]|nr:hypothetical protein [Phycisphaerae bacterium]